MPMPRPTTAAMTSVVASAVNRSIRVRLARNCVASPLNRNVSDASCARGASSSWP